MQENGSLTTLNLEVIMCSYNVVCGEGVSKALTVCLQKNGVSAKWLEEIAQRLEEVSVQGLSNARVSADDGLSLTVP